MKEFLSRAGHSFTLKQVDDDFDAYSELIARGFRSAEALMALMQLHLGSYQPTLPGRPRAAGPPSRRPATDYPRSPRLA